MLGDSPRRAAVVILVGGPLLTVILLAANWDRVMPLAAPGRLAAVVVVGALVGLVTGLVARVRGVAGWAAAICAAMFMPWAYWLVFVAWFYSQMGR
jgi:hypothetical protein